jgi:D-aminopeptidase
VTVDISFKHYTQAEAAAFLRVIERVDAHSIRFRARDMAEAADFVEFLLTYGQDLQP